MKKALSILVMAVLVFSVVLYIGACGDKKSDEETNTNDQNAANQAAAQASAVSGSVKLSATVGQSTDVASGSIPSGYAPGKGGAIDTSAIANIDPRLKDVVDKMMEQLQKPIVRNSLSKARSYKPVNSAPISVGTTTTNSCPAGGTTTITLNSEAISGSTTTTTITVSFSNCRDTFGNEELNGSISATHAVNTSTLAETANITATNLSNNIYTNSTFNNILWTFALNGTFNAIDNVSNGNNSAQGTFTWTIPSTSGNTVMSFTFGSGGPVTDAWTDTNPSGNGTITHTGNGVFSLSITAPNSPGLTLSVTLSNLEDKVQTDSSWNESEWVNGSVNISWSPDMSQYGCKAGTFTVATSQSTPIYTVSGAACPTSGTVTVNNITVKFGSPSGSQVTVTDGNGNSATFADCHAFDNSGGMCN